MKIDISNGYGRWDNWRKLYKFLLLQNLFNGKIQDSKSILIS